jgi:soluble lytic murein transglycosylase
MQVLRRRLSLGAGLALVLLAVLSLVRPADHAVQEIFYIARKSGGTRFQRADLATPQINIAYGTWYLRYLLDKYKGNTILTLAAYNAGEGKVDEWRAVAAARGEKFRVASHIPFKETRDYVHRVLSARKDYRTNYANELGLK